MIYNWYFRKANAEIRQQEWQPDELKQTVLAAQRQEQAAIDLLCTRFEPLIMTALYEELQSSDLNWEEARNYAWLEFLNLIANYQGQRYEELPGLIHLRIHDRLKRYRAHNAYISINEGSQEEVQEDAITTIETARQTAKKQSLLKELRQAVKQLPPNQRYVVEAYYLTQAKQKDIAAQLCLSPRQIINIKNKALSNLAHQLQS